MAETFHQEAVEWIIWDRTEIPRELLELKSGGRWAALHRDGTIHNDLIFHQVHGAFLYWQHYCGFVAYRILREEEPNMKWFASRLYDAKKENHATSLCQLPTCPLDSKQSSYVPALRDVWSDKSVRGVL